MTRHFLLAVLLLLPAVASAQVIPVSAPEAQAWVRYTVPLPRSISSIPAKFHVTALNVAIVPPSPGDIVTEQVCKELRVSMGLAENAPNPPSPAFTIRMQIDSPEADPLRSLKNSIQAYLIAPAAGDTELKLVALSSRGIYYAAKTVQELVAPTLAGGAVDIPLLTVTDWPEMADRGLWGSDSFLKLRWMADRKLNYDEQIAARQVDVNTKVGTAWYKPGYDTLSNEGPKYGITPQPCVLHLEQHGSTGAFQAYPLLQALNGKQYAMCFGRPSASYPDSSRVICDWVASLKQLPCVTGASVWMTENYSGGGSCQCSVCSTGNISVREGDAIVAAWQEAKNRVGPMDLRILTTEATKIAKFPHANLPPETKIWYYHSLLTYTAYKTAMIPTEIVNYINLGRYAGPVPTIGAFYGLPHPFTGPQFVNYRFTEFVNRNCGGWMGYATPTLLHNRFNVEAAAEWSWNPTGRSVREFAASWAVRQGFADPEKFADWAEVSGPVTWDIYGGGWPESEQRNNPGHAADLLRSGTLPALGSVYLTVYKGPWSQIKTLSQFDMDVAQSVVALRLAQEMGIPEFWYESLVANGYITALRALYELKSLVVGGTVSSANRPAARAYFNLYVMGMRQAVAALQGWEAAIYPPSGTGHVASMVSTLLNPAINDMKQLAADCGCAVTDYSYIAPAITIPEAKASSDNVIAQLCGEVVTSNSGAYYIQDTSRGVGIRVTTTKTLPALTPVAITGPITTVSGERAINAWLVSTVGGTSPMKPVLMQTEDLGGGAFGLQQAVKEWTGSSAVPTKGLNNVGVLAKIAGKVTYVGASYFYVDDGCACDDGSGYIGVRVLSGSLVKPALNARVAITGVSSTYYERGNIWRAIQTRTQDDIQVLP